MAKPSMVKVLELCRVSPQPNPNITTLLTSLPLTFLDIPWLLFPPSQPLFFYEFPDPTQASSLDLPDTAVLIQTLKHSFSLALALFYPLAGALVLPGAEPRKPAIVCGGGADSVSFAVAESDGDFGSLSSHCLQRDAKEFRELVPQLVATPLSTSHDRDDHGGDDRARADEIVPLMAVQVTVFPNAGFCLGLAIHHVAADARTFNNFMKVWSSFCSSYLGRLRGGDNNTEPLEFGRYFCSSPTVESVRPCFDRTVIVDPHGLEGVFMNEWRRRRRTKKSSSLLGGAMTEMGASTGQNLVRATFLVGPGDMERIKSWIVTFQLCKNRSEPHSLYLSPYVLTCALVWVCLVKAQQAQEQGGLATDPNYFGFIAGGLTRVGHPVPAGYFGNCVGFGRAAAARGELLREDGILIAARALGATVKRLDRAMFGGAEKWILEWEELIGSGVHVVVSGSPKVDLYARDFGWGRPKKIEEVEIDSTKAVSLSESRDVKGGIEIGLVLPKPQMDAFTLFFKEGIKALSSSHLIV